MREGRDARRRRRGRRGGRRRGRGREGGELREGGRASPESDSSSEEFALRDNEGGSERDDFRR